MLVMSMYSMCYGLCVLVVTCSGLSCLMVSLTGCSAAWGGITTLTPDLRMQMIDNMPYVSY